MIVTAVRRPGHAPIGWVRPVRAGSAGDVDERGRAVR
ncbi:hypothetical protein Ae168Ps1_0349c [Pseudonocardia sp. Ae168_Ps1]|nr:hypothetical protein Ae150APs1_0354c [Pseudonocardia sp. Ae150A_Ps1]OLL77943.1 hypothetical protein Ae168Ps1_0349c [Pseudonocardia sp. Ae168_Ps1]OLL87934.1 hypothetical protein Ae263Ps1_4989 [Pseudonocardia sp. Ae263_Ps1]OLL92041.1 hypothetical protein Ae356Ps1_1938c [Pseudonocardia sp. Ae356_Ps1]